MELLKLKINIIELLRFIIVLIFLTPIFLLSNHISGSLFRDNFIYNNGYKKLDIQNNLIENYLFFLTETGAPEPLSFLIFLVGSNLDFEYNSVIIIKNIVFIIIISFLTIKYFKNNIVFFVFCIYISTDYYLLRMMSELHRIHFAILFILLCLLYFKNIFIPILLSTLFHLQSIFFIIFYRIKLSDIIKIILIISPIILIVLPTLSSKLMIYQKFDVFSFLKVILVGSLFFVTNRYWPKDIFYRLISGVFIIGISSIFLGSDRLLFVIWEMLILILFYYYENNILKKINFKNFFLLLIIFLIPYNVYRIKLFIFEVYFNN